MAKKMLVFTMVLIVVSLGLQTTIALADEQETGDGYPWRNHIKPYDFQFGNLIDSHQQTKLLPNGSLVGSVYIQFTGEEINGIPVAVRADCTDPALDCRVGWAFQGVPMQASLVQKNPRKWKVEASDLPAMSGYAHFHWLGNPMKPCGLILDDGADGVLYDGYLLKRTAVREFYWLGGSENENHQGRLVSVGEDLHSNIVTDWDYSGDGNAGEPSGGCGGHDDGGGCSGHDDSEGCAGHDDSGGCAGADDSGGCGGHDDGGS